MSEIVKVNQNVIPVRELHRDLESSWKMAGALAYLTPGNNDQEKRAQCFAQICVGAELGLPPAASVRGLYFVKGKIGMSADLMAGLAKDEGWRFAVSHSDPKGEWVKIVATHKDGDDEPYTFMFTMDMAKSAGLSGDNWRKYPWDMLYARCMAHVARKCCPQRLLGLYTTAELEHDTPTDAADAPTFTPPTVDHGDDPLLAEVTSPTEGTDADQTATEDVTEAEIVNEEMPVWEQRMVQLSEMTGWDDGTVAKWLCDELECSAADLSEDAIFADARAAIQKAPAV